MSPMTIRAVRPDDFAAWLPLWQGYQAFYRVAISPATTEVTWARLLDPAEPMAAALACHEDGRALGLVHTIRHRSCWTIGDYCYLQDLFVASDARGLGLGRALIEHVHRAAAASGCARVHWLTHETNQDAMLLYDRIGDRSGFVQYRKLF
jgi:GNAT superfamily N-acetyltransferase